MVRGYVDNITIYYNMSNHVYPAEFTGFFLGVNKQYRQNGKQSLNEGITMALPSLLSKVCPGAPEHLKW